LSGFAKRKDEFTALNTKLLGLSIDSVYAHLGWIRNVYERTGVLFNFPIIADINMHVAHLYGMVQPGVASTVAVRAVFFIDPKQTIRLIMYYPLNVGRNMDEIIRALKALQLTDTAPVATPLDWQPGDEVVIHAPETLAGVQARMEKKEEGLVDFYLLKKKI
jgi:antioxidant, ahpC/TSA family protein